MGTNTAVALHHAPLDLSAAERRALLAARPIFRDLPASAREDVDAALESVYLPGGARIVRRGQTGVPLFLVARGGLRATVPDGSGRPRLLSEYFRGSTVGEALVLSGRPSPYDLHAIRDSQLLCLTPEKFTSLAERHPDLALRFARLVTTRLLDLLDAPDTLETFCRSADRLPRSIALLSVGGAAVGQTRDWLARALASARTTTRLSIRNAREAMADGVERYSESAADLVLFECDRSDPSWLDFSLRHADRIMVLIEDDQCPAAGRELDWWRTSTLEGRAGHVELAVVHSRSTVIPHAGSALADLPGVARLHHVKDGDAQDAERLARWLMDRPVGLVLGGGGAYGIAHVGVLKALEEARVPVDVVGGTSMGAIFAGGLALGWSADRIMQEVRTLFSVRFALYDPTIPVSSLLAGKKLERVLGGFFEDIPFVDLWRPFFCIATNLSRACPHVHESGSVTDAIRSSCSIPGLFPPFRTDGQLLVDGGLVDNLPVDVMVSHCRGPIIAVDVFPYEPQGAEPGGQAKGRVSGFLRKIGPLAEGGPPLFDTLTRSTLLGSQRTTETTHSSHPPALHLVPELTQFRILEWSSYEAIYRAGYECAKRKLEAGALPRALWEGRIEDPAAG
jgi:NTE family protein